MHEECQRVFPPAMRAPCGFGVNDRHREGAAIATSGSRPGQGRYSIGGISSQASSMVSRMVAMAPSRSSSQMLAQVP